MALSECITKVNEQGKELLEHGSAFFPVACYHDDLLLEEVIWHWHEELELILVTEGSALVSVGTEKYTVEEGCGMFINTGVLHAVHAVSTESCRLHSIVFHPRLVGGSMDSIYWQKYLNPLLSDSRQSAVYYDSSIEWHKESLKALELAWQTCVYEKDGYEFAAREELSKIIFLLADHHTVMKRGISDKNIRNAERMKRMLQYIHEHYTEEITTLQIAESAMISTSECLRCFHAMIGITPIQYVKQYRIQCAAELLTSTSMKIVDIGIQCGFQDMSYFAKIFREMRGCTPQQYRKEHAVR